MSRATFIKIIKVILPLALGVFFIWYAVYTATPEERQKILQYILQANPFWVFCSVLLGVMAHLSRAFRWNYLLKPLGYQPPLALNFMAVMIGYVANLGIPRSGEVLRAGTLASYTDIPLKKVFGTIVSERIIDLIMLLLVVVITLFFQSQELFTYLNSKIQNSVLVLLFILLLIGAGMLFLRLVRSSEHPFLVKIRNFGDGVVEGVKSIFLMEHKGAFLAHTLFIWTLYIAMFYVTKFTVPETATLGIGPMLAAFVTGSFAMSATNGGLGVFPIAIALTLELFQIEHSAGEAFGWILWSAQTLTNIVIGGLAFLILPLFYNRNNTSK